MLHQVLVAPVGEVERGPVVGLDDEERTEGHRCGQAEDLAHERGGLVLVGHADDRVVELNSHDLRLAGRRRTVNAARG